MKNNKIFFFFTQSLFLSFFFSNMELELEELRATVRALRDLLSQAALLDPSCSSTFIDPVIAHNYRILTSSPSSCPSVATSDDEIGKLKARISELEAENAQLRAIAADGEAAILRAKCQEQEAQIAEMAAALRELWRENEEINE